MSLIPAGLALYQAAQSGQLNSVAAAFGIGPGYDPANGGEIRRQLEQSNWPSDRLNMYLAWTKQYQPSVFAGTQSCWDAQPNVSAWFAAHEANGGVPMDGNLRPATNNNPNPMGNGTPMNKNLDAPNKLRVWWELLKSGKAPWWQYALMVVAFLLLLWLVFGRKKKKGSRRRSSGRKGSTQRSKYRRY